MRKIYSDRPGPAVNKAARPVTETKTAPGDIRKANTAQLKELANQLGVDISGAKTNAERAELIIAATEQ